MPVTSTIGKEVGEVVASTGNRRVSIDYSIIEGNELLLITDVMFLQYFDAVGWVF